MKNPRIALASSIFLAALACSVPHAKAQTTWNGAGTDNNWSTGGNWAGGSAPVNSGTSSIASFAGSTRLSPNVDTPWTLYRVEFLAGASSFNITGTTLTLWSNNTTTTSAVVNNSSVLQTISAPIVIGSTVGTASYAINAANGDITINGNINAGVNRLVPTGGAGRNITISGVLSGAGSSNGSISTANNLFLGSLTLSGVNTFTGAVGVTTGTLILGGDALSNTDGTLGHATTAVTLGISTSANAAALITNGAYTVGRNITLANSTAAVNTMSVGSITTSGTSTFSGTITMGNSATGHALTLTSAAGGTVNFSGVLAGVGTDDLDAVTKVGGGKAILGGINTYSGTTAVTAGTLLVNGSYSVSGQAVAVSASATLGGTGTINRAVTVAGTGVLLGGTGDVSTGLLTMSGNVTLGDASVVSLVLGASGAHSSIARTGGTWTFDSDQAFTFINAGATNGLYDNIITGLTVDPGVAGWTITNAGWVGTFSYDGANVDLTLTSVPEPGTVALFGAGLTIMLIRMRKRTNS